MNIDDVLNTPIGNSFNEKVLDDDVLHYGIPRRSGRYPWGSGLKNGKAKAKERINKNLSPAEKRKATIARKKREAEEAKAEEERKKEEARQAEEKRKAEIAERHKNAELRRRDVEMGKVPLEEMSSEEIMVRMERLRLERAYNSYLPKTPEKQANAFIEAGKKVAATAFNEVLLPSATEAGRQAIRQAIQESNRRKQAEANKNRKPTLEEELQRARMLYETSNYKRRYWAEQEDLKLMMKGEDPKWARQIQNGGNNNNNNNKNKNKNKNKNR